MKKDNLKKKLRMLLTSLSLLSFSCSSLPDKPICAEVRIDMGKCTYLVSGRKITVDDDNLLDGKTWFDIRRQSLTMPADSWSAIKAWIIKTCKKYGCDTEVSSWDRTIETIDEAVNEEPVLIVPQPITD